MIAHITYRDTSGTWTVTTDVVTGAVDVHVTIWADTSDLQDIDELIDQIPDKAPEIKEDCEQVRPSMQSDTMPFEPLARLVRNYAMWFG